MTQNPCAQRKRAKSALQGRSEGRTLAQKRADLEAQVRDYLGANDLMSMLELEQVAERLQYLLDRLKKKRGKEITQAWVAARIGVATRTYQTWLGAKNEPNEREKFEQLAKLFRKELGDAKITTNWIMYGQERAPDLAAPDVVAALNGMPDKVPTQLKRIEEKLDDALAALQALAPDAAVKAASDAAQAKPESGHRSAREPLSNAKPQARGRRRAGQR